MPVFAGQRSESSSKSGGAATGTNFVVPVDRVPPAARDGEAPALPGAADVAAALRGAERGEASERAELGSAAAREERSRSISAFADAGPDEAKQLLRSEFADTLAAVDGDPARLLADVSIERALGESAAIVSSDGVPSLLDSGAPVRAKGEDGELSKVDLSLVGAEGGRYEPANPLTDVSLPPAADQAVLVGPAGLGIRQVGAAESEARRFGEMDLFYPGVGRDADLLVAPIAGGVELFNQLRSAESPESLAFEIEMPSGAELRPAGGGAEVWRGERRIAMIPAPVAVDAQGTEVPITLEVKGDTIVLAVSHREADFAYPILVDPVLVEDWYAASWYSGYNLAALTDGTWVWGTNSSVVYGSTSCILTCWGSHRGLYVSTPSGSIPANNFGQWTYTPPGTTSYVTNSWIYPFFRDNHVNCPKSSYPQPHDYAGLWTGIGWAPLTTNQANDVGSAYLEGGGRSIVIGLGTAGAASIPCWRDIVAGGVSAYITDPDVPSWTAYPSASEQWTDTTVRPISAGAYDAGLGVRYFNLYTSPGTPESFSFIGNADRGCSGLHANPCTGAWSGQISNYNPASLPNGVNWLTVYAYDVFGIVPGSTHNSEGRPVNVNVDHSAPQITLNGDLFTEEPESLEGEVVVSDGSSSSFATAQSGVKSVKLYIDGQLAGRVPDEASPPACSNVQEGVNVASCEFKIPIEPSGALSGPHSFKVVAFDSLDHEAKKEVTLNLPEDETPPSLTASGPLKEASGRWVPSEAVGVTLEAGDPGGTGVTEAEILVDGEPAVTPFEQPCLDGGCDLEKAFQVDLKELSSGAHTVKAIVKDGVGNEASDSWTVSVDPQDPSLDSVEAPEVSEDWTEQLSSFELEYAASDADSGIKKVEVQRPSSGGSTLTSAPFDSECTGSAESPCPETASGSVTISTEDMAQGVDEVTVKAYDAAGRVSGSETIVVLVDRDGPTITAASGPLLESPPELIGVVTDFELEVEDKGGGIGTVEFLLDEEPTEVLGFEEISELGGVESCEGELCQLEFSTEPLVGGGFEPGEHEFELVVTDKAGHSASLSNDVLLDTHVPEVDLSGSLMESLGQSLEGNPVQLDVVADDGDGEFDAGLESLEVTVDGEPLEGFPSKVGMVAVADEGNDRVQILNEDGDLVRVIGSPGSEDGELDRPTGVAIDASRHLWVADSGNDRVQAFSEKGEHLLTIGSSGDGDGEFERPEGVAIGGDGDVWVADTGNGRLQKFDPEGEFLAATGFQTPEAGSLGEPVDVAADPEGGIWVVDRQYDRVVLFDAEGGFVRQFGVSGGGQGKLTGPESVDLDAEGTIWVADQGNARIQGFDRQGQYVGELGSGGTGLGQFSYPAGVASDAEGRIWVADSSRERRPAPLPEDRDPVAAYSFDEGAGDVLHDSAGRHEGRIEGAEWSEAGKFGSALHFNGEDQWVEVPDSDELDFDDTFTIEAWVRPEQHHDWATVVAKGEPVEADGFSFLLYGSNHPEEPPRAWISDAEDGVEGGSGPEVLPLEAWAHLALTSDGEELRFYIDGELVDTDNTLSPRDTEAPLVIGGNQEWSEYFEGLIDEVRLYDVSLSEEEIEADMETAIGEAPKRPVVALSFDEGSGAVAHDSAGGHDGDLDGAEWSEAGRFGGALQFDEDSVEVPDSEEFDLSDEFTIEAWVKPEENEHPWQPVVLRAGSAQGSYGLYATDEGEEAPPAAYTSSGLEEWFPAVGEDPLPLDSWTHLAATADGETLRLFQDGDLIASSSLVPAQDTDAPLRIGGYDAWSEFFRGLIDEVRLYDVSLSEEEIEADMVTAIGEAPRPKPVAALSFDEGAGDLARDSAGDNDGVVEGATWVEGRHGGALAFDAEQEDQVTIPNSEHLRFEDFTIEAWVNPAQAAEWAPVITKTNPTDYGYALFGGGELVGKPEGVITNQYWVDSYAYDGTAMEPNSWTHLALSSNGERLRLYVDGELADERSASEVRAGRGDLLIGANQLWGGEYFDGKIDEVRLYGEALAVDEIEADMEAGIGSASPPAGPVAAFSFDEGSGTVVHDSASAHDGTLVGGQWVEAGKHGSALKFDGVDDLVKIADDGDLDFTRSFTLEAWVKPGSTQGEAPIISNETWNFFSYRLDVGGDGFSGIAQGGVADADWSYESLHGGGVLPNETWSHLAFSYGGELMRLYVDGELVAQNEAPPAQVAGQDLLIGASDTLEEFFEGTIDEVRLYGERLGSTEIAADMASEIGAAQEEPEPDPVAAYSFAEGEGATVRDLVGDNDGSVNGAQWSGAGRFDSALEFDGVDDLLTIPDSEALDFTSAFTLEAWVKPAEQNHWSAVFTKERDGSLSYQLHAEGDGEAPAGYVSDGDGLAEVGGSSPLPSGEWSHVALTSNGEQLRIYVDGELEQTAPARLAAPGDDDLQIGGNLVWGEEDAFAGLIDEVRLYDAALGEARIAEDAETPVEGAYGGDRVQLWNVSGEAPTFVEAFGSHGDAAGDFNLPADIAIAAGGPGEIAESFTYDPEVWGSEPRTVTVTATDLVGNVDVEEVQVNHALSAIAPQCPSAEPEMASGGEALTTQEVIADIEESVPGALESNEEATEMTLDPEVTTEPEGVSLNELGIDVVESEAGGGIESEAAGAFTAGQMACLQPLDSSLSALEPTIVNDTAVVYPNSAPDSDTVIRPTAVGTAIIQRIRGTEAPTEFSWKIGLAPGEELVELEDGAIAVVDPEGLDLDPEEIPTDPEGELDGLSSPEIQLAEAEHELAEAETEVEGEVKMVVSVPDLVDAEEEVTPGLLKIGGANVVTAKLPPGAVADTEAMIIRLSPAAEPESMCMSVMARTPQYAAAACGWEELEEDEEEEGVGPPFSLIELAQTSDATLNGEITKQVGAYHEGISSSGAEVSYSASQGKEHKKFCRKPKYRDLCKRFEIDGQLAVWAEDDLFNITTDNTVGNAFRHSLWTSLMRRTEPKKLEYAGMALSIAHEESMWKGSNPRKAERWASRMDILNNFVGTNHSSTSDMLACELILDRARRAHYLGVKTDPFQWRERVGYLYQRPVYRRRNDKESGARVYPNGDDCDDIRIGWGPFQVNPFAKFWNEQLR